MHKVFVRDIPTSGSRMSQEYPAQKLMFRLLFTSCNNRGQKINANFFLQSFSTTLRVMDVRAENRGRPHQKVRFPAAPVVGRNFLTPGHPGVRVRNVRGKSGPKNFCLCCFLFPEISKTATAMQTQISRIKSGNGKGNGSANPQDPSVLKTLQRSIP